MNEFRAGRFHRKKLRLDNFDYANPNYVYFLTVCARHLTMPFADANLADQVVSSLFFLRKQKGVSLYCYCLMPDHLHLAVSPSESSGAVSHILRGFKSHTTRVSWSYGINGKLWQKSFYDHIARRDEDLVAICRYILHNPVRKGLVENLEDWKHSGLLDPLPV